MRGVILFCLLAACARAPQRPPDLEAAYRRLEAQPQQGEGYLELARLYLLREDYLRARQYLALAEARPVKDKDRQALSQLALVIAVRSGQYDEAIRLCRQRLEQKEEPEVRRLLAALLEGVSRFPESERERQLLVAALPHDPHPLIELARFYERWSRPERAVALYQRYLQAAPQGAEADRARAALRALAVENAGDGQGMK
jgi:tetratricopeptide (TPR) repeat protein